MNRRGFLTALAGASAFALDPDRALWVPGAKTISIPRPLCFGRDAYHRAAMLFDREARVRNYLLDGEIRDFKEFIPGWAIAPIHLDRLNVRKPARLR